LLAAHGVASARHANRLARGARRRERGGEVILRLDRHHAIDARGVELGMDVVDQNLPAVRAP
jgi:hypothetical protein